MASIPGGPLSSGAKKLLEDAWAKMLESKSKDAFGRRIRRGWKYGDGKKELAKVGTGVAVGVAFVGISIATGGAATPVVIALAAGGFAAGQAHGAAWAIIGNRKGLRGVSETANWVSTMAVADPEMHREKIKKLDTAAHKTLRRAYEHYRTALRKSRKSEEVLVQIKAMPYVPCSVAFELIEQSLSVSHHLYKARLYLEPAIYLQRVLLVALREWIDDWKKHEAALNNLVNQALGPNGINHKKCGSKCYAKAHVRSGTAVPMPALLTDVDLDFLDDQLADLFEQLSVGSVAPKPVGSVPQSAIARTNVMMKDATMTWKNRRNSVQVRTRHFISNTFARKTKSERIAFGVQQGVGVVAAVASTAGAQAADPAIKAATEILPKLDLGIELGAFVADTARDIGGGMLIDMMVDKAVDGPEIDVGTDLAHHDGSTASATKNRDLLRKAAQHIQEADERRKVVHELRDVVLTTCWETREFARHVYAVRHHIGKAQTYLRQSIGMTLCVGEAMRISETRWRKNLTEVYEFVTKVVARKDHSMCDEIGCYGPAGMHALQTPRARILI